MLGRIVVRCMYIEHLHARGCCRSVDEKFHPPALPPLSLAYARVRVAAGVRGWLMGGG